jgi:hypothetical protein
VTWLFQTALVAEVMGSLLPGLMDMWFSWYWLVVVGACISSARLFLSKAVSITRVWG